MQSKLYYKDIDKEKSSIFLEFYVNKKRLRFTTGITVAINEWNPKTEKVKAPNINRIELNLKLKKMRSRYEELAEELCEKYTTVTTKMLKSAYSNLDADNIFEAYSKFMTYKYDRVAVRTVNDFKNLLAHMKGHFNTSSKVDDVDVAMSTEFQSYMMKQGLSNSTVNEYMKIFTSFLNYCVSAKIKTRNLEYKVEERLKHVDRYKVVLTDEELAKLKDYTFKRKGLERVRKVFLLGCLTGLRMSDIRSLNSSNLLEQNGEWFIVKYQIKTLNQVKIPLNETSLSIAREVIDGSLRICQPQKLNLCIKLIFEMLGFDELVEMVDSRGGKHSVTTQRRCDLVTMHSSRHTFITRLIRAGVPLHVIIKYSGHNNIKSLESYAVIHDTDDFDHNVKNLI
ncbi:site-specific integrase [Flammeovirga yaeyamensis]|uniref:Site-specific integrase n=1 Tax=Flammeovirga yaeyamensis TaxID=367791 RepID=A0AAX1NAV8_9BACT|nr:tyrosine-type recombinase/integrase [Flammeovirga yaeyamensis]MBB3700001.1 integrase [Flammeovirga yaeyamensis]NMF37560.1 tyrosine-type recombinase/integrase [Flammeovirga yaeyamensis]QWG04617.1 site-specific integrase [Flammeovirga yaeyamensis]